jgi:hypothetical protein
MAIEIFLLKNCPAGEKTEICVDFFFFSFFLNIINVFDWGSEINILTFSNSNK